MDLIDQDFQTILDLGNATIYLTELLNKKYHCPIVSLSDSIASSKLLMDEEELEYEANKFDLITYSLGLHWINDIQKFLVKIRKILKPNGIFIGNFIGGSSFRVLRQYLIKTEIAANFSHSPHISPFIHFDHVPALFSHSGFVEIIVDYENIELNFKTPIELMREIKSLGESNALQQQFNYTVSKKMLSILMDDVNNFQDQISLISFIASPSKNSINAKFVPRT